jgi:hypothetical protein
MVPPWYRIKNLYFLNPLSYVRILIPTTDTSKELSPRSKKAQITTLANTVAKIAKKVKA